MKTKRHVLLLAIPLTLTLIVAGAVVLAFIIQFSERPFSSSVEHWGQTGDYFGGILNPIIAVMNLFVTFYIAKEIHDLTNHQGQAQVDAQKSLLRRQLQFDQLKNYNDNFKKHMTTILFLRAVDEPNKPAIKKEIIELIVEASSFEDTAMMLFNSLSGTPARLALLKPISDSLYEYAHCTLDDMAADDTLHHKVLTLHQKLLTYLYKEVLL